MAPIAIGAPEAGQPSAWDFVNQGKKRGNCLSQSGKRGSNPRPSAWEADALPLSYSRIWPVWAAQK